MCSTTHIEQGFVPHFRPPEGTTNSCSANHLEKIGATRFELATSRSRTVRSIQAELRPAKQARTCSPQPGHLTPARANACCNDLSDPVGSVNQIEVAVAGRKSLGIIEHNLRASSTVRKIVADAALRQSGLPSRHWCERARASSSRLYRVRAPVTHAYRRCNPPGRREAGGLHPPYGRSIAATCAVYVCTQIIHRSNEIEM